MSEEGSSKAKSNNSQSGSVKAGLVFPVDLIDRRLRTEGYAERVGVGAPGTYSTRVSVTQHWFV